MKKLLTSFRKLIPYVTSDLWGGSKPDTTFKSFLMFWGYVPVMINFAAANFMGLIAIRAITPKGFDNMIEKGDYENNFFFSPKNFMDFAGIGIIEYHLAAMSFNLGMSLLYSTLGYALYSSFGLYVNTLLTFKNLVTGIFVFVGVVYLLRFIKRKTIDAKNSKIHED